MHKSLVFGWHTIYLCVFFFVFCGFAFALIFCTRCLIRGPGDLHLCFISRVILFQPLSLGLWSIRFNICTWCEFGVHIRSYVCGYRVVPVPPFLKEMFHCSIEWSWYPYWKSIIYTYMSLFMTLNSKTLTYNRSIVMPGPHFVGLL